MAMTLEEEKLPEKLNLGVWLRILKYAFKRLDLLIVIFSMMIITTFYDSSLVPAMNASAIALMGNSAALAVSSIWELQFHIVFIKGLLEIDISFLAFLIIQIACILMRSLSIFIVFYFTNYLSMVVMVSLRQSLFRHVQELSFSYFDHTNSGWIIARMNNDTSSIGDVISWNLISILWCLFDLFFTIITMFSQNVKYAIIVTLSIPIIAIIIPIFERVILERHRIARNAYSAYVGWLAEIINGAKTVKTLSLEDKVEKESQDVANDLMKKRFKAGRMDALLYPLLNVIMTATITIIIVIGYHDMDGALLMGSAAQIAVLVATIVLFIGFAKSIYGPLEGLANTFSEFMANQAGVEKVQQLLDAKVEVKDSEEVIEKYGTVFEPKVENYEPFNGEIEFQNVTFGYDNGIEIIHPLNLKIKSGTSLAIVGETGSGKTTLANLLCRFYEPSSGKILLDGRDYKERSLGWLRSNIGYVQQSPFVFSTTYFNNIAYGKLDASEKEVQEAAKIVGIDGFIKHEKNGYQTVLSDGGSSLSQGQKQLISFARAIIRNPSILILDEATSSIDAETEAEVQKAIAPILKGRTSITIAHRLSTIVNSDRIIVMDKGKIVEDGNHKTLMERKGRYYDLYMNQFNDMSLDKQLKTYEEQIENKNIKI